MQSEHEYEFPQQVCTACVKLLHQCYSFQQKCINSHKKIETYLKNLQDVKPGIDLDSPDEVSEIEADESGKESHESIVNQSVTNMFECEQCDLKFRSEELLNNHVHVKVNKSKMHQCKICRRYFNSDDELSVHQKVHRGHLRYTCEHCGKVYRQHASLAHHLRQHKGVRPFLCSICGKTYIMSYQLKVHMRIHNGERPYVCTICGKTFAANSHFLKHVRTHNDAKPFECRYVFKPLRLFK